MRVHVEEEDSAEEVGAFHGWLQQDLEIRIRGFLISWQIAAMCTYPLRRPLNNQQSLF